MRPVDDEGTAPQLDSLAVDELTDCLQATFDLVFRLVDLSAMSGRQGLLFVVLSLLCSLLSPQPPSTDWVGVWRVSRDIPTAKRDLLRTGVHLLTLERLVAFTPCFSADVRTVLPLLGDLKQRLELALKHRVHTTGAKTPSVDELARLGKLGRCAQPIIKLKTDFSNFT